MNLLKKIAMVASMALVIGVLASTVKAEENDQWLTAVHFAEPVQIGNLSLAPGNYVFQRSSDNGDRCIVMIYNTDRNEWQGMVVGIPAYRREDSHKLAFTFGEQKGTNKEVLEYWFYGNHLSGIEFPAENIQSPVSVQASAHTVQAKKNS
jgi:hypothetical protein